MQNIAFLRIANYSNPAAYRFSEKYTSPVGKILVSFISDTSSY